MVLLSLAMSANAASILGSQLFYVGGDVTVESLPVSSGYTNELGLYDSTFTRVLYIMNDEPAGVTMTFDPSDYGFAVGDELTFGIRAVSDGNREYFMGWASRNPDNVIHAAVDDLGGGMFVVDFEDLFNGGDSTTTIARGGSGGGSQVQTSRVIPGDNMLLAGRLLSCGVPRFQTFQDRFTGPAIAKRRASSEFDFS